MTNYEPLQGFQRVSDALPDTVLDNPAAGLRFKDMQAKAEAAGWLDGAPKGAKTHMQNAVTSTSAAAQGLQVFRLLQSCACSSPHLEALVHRPTAELSFHSQKSRYRVVAEREHWVKREHSSEGSKSSSLCL